MYVHSVKLINFKSIGDYPEAEIILEPRITAIVGQNESGKSNVLDGLSRIRFTTKNADAFHSNVANRNGSANKINKYSLVLKPSAEDKKNGITEETTLEFTKDGCIATGGFLSYYEKEMRGDIDAFLTSLGSATSSPFPLNDSDLSNYRAFCAELKNGSKINIARTSEAVSFFKNRLEKLPVDKYETIKEAVIPLTKKWSSIIRVLPVFFYRNTDKHLNSLYKFEDIERELQNPSSYPNSLLSAFVKVIGVSTEEFLHAAKVGTATTQDTVRSRIKRLVNKKINEPFHNFYQTESIYLDVYFNHGTITFTVQSEEGEALSLGERSNGLRWYLETFIDSQANGIPDRNVIYLFDEPGISLHVKAQEKLLELFGHLADSGNQVVYTTHSPHMLNTETEGLHRIRAVVKDSDGYTYIYKSAYDARIAPNSQKDTLTPIIAALGMSLNNTFGPSKNKINIVPEGMSDYIYLCTMSKRLGIDMEKYTIIPSVGASNCRNICAILHGWGCKYIALFDFDKEGVESGGEYLRKELFFEHQKQYCYVKDVTEDEIKQTLYKTAAYEIEDVVQQSEIMRFCSEFGVSTDLGKPLTAKLLCTAIENGEFKLCEESVANFKKLFARLEKYTA